MSTPAAPPPATPEAMAAQRERDELSGWLMVFHHRLRRAKRRGQVELHVSLEDAATLLQHAQVAASLYHHTKARPR